MFLDVLSSRDVEVGVAPEFVLFLPAVLLGGDREVVGDLADHFGLLGRELPARHLGPDHEVASCFWAYMPAHFRRSHSPPPARSSISSKESPSSA